MSEQTAFTTRVKRSGGSYIVRIPPIQIELLELEIDDIVDVILIKKKSHNSD